MWDWEDHERKLLRCELQQQQQRETGRAFFFPPPTHPETTYLMELSKLFSPSLAVPRLFSSSYLVYPSADDSRIHTVLIFFGLVTILWTFPLWLYRVTDWQEIGSVYRLVCWGIMMTRSISARRNWCQRKLTSDTVWEFWKLNFPSKSEIALLHNTWSCWSGDVMSLVIK